MTNKLAVLTAVERRLAAVHTVDEAKDIRDKAEAIRVYAKSAHMGLAVQNRAAAIKILAEQRGGALLKQVERSKGGRGKTQSSLSRVYTDNGIAPATGKMWQTMSAVPEEKVRELEAEKTEAHQELTSSLIYTLAKGGVHFSSGSDEWETPQDLFELLNSEFRFTLDVCATVETAKCEPFFSREQDGLSQEWSGRCWMNPPYGQEIGRWVRKASESAKDGTFVVCLLPARVDTEWWWDYCRWGEIRFLRGRLKFGGGEHSAPFPSAIVVFGCPSCVVWWEAWPIT